MTIAPARQDRRIAGPPPGQGRAKRAADEKPPAVLPKWAIIKFQEYESQLHALREEVRTLKMTAVVSDSAQRAKAQQEKALAMYGDGEVVKSLASRLMVLLPNADKLGAAGVALVAQITVAHGLDPLPGSDHVYAWTEGQTIKVTIGYKGLLHLARQKVQFTHTTRPMNDAERQEHMIQDNEVGYVTELWVISEAFRCKQAGIPYHPIKGTAVWRKGDRVPASKTAAWVAGKNSLKDALRQIVSTGQRLTDALDAAFRQAEYDGENWSVEVPDEQAAIESGIIPPSEDFIDGEVTEETPAVCAHCKKAAPDPDNPIDPALCSECANRAADKQ